MPRCGTMPDDPQNPGSLGDDRTFMGEQERVSGDTRSLGAEDTRGDAGDSSSDEFRQVLDAFDEVVDLAKRYDIQGELGAGGMGKVLKAVDKRLGRTVALKFLLPELGNSAQALRRFMTEAKTIATLNHNNIVQIYEMERSAEGPFIVMEYVEGGSLVDLLKNGALELETAVDIICQVCDGLGIAHDHGITHRDIKPANILMTNGGVPKLSDFGLARQTAADHGQTQVGAVLGTIDFMAPEQRLDATSVDARSDLWSLAATLYQMVTGRSPKVIRLDLVDGSLRPILAQALEDAKADRYQSAAELRDALRASLQATHSGMIVDVDLGSGECPACHAKNEPSRKFCINPACAASLRVKCLACEIEIPVWEVICGDCGQNQKDLLATRRDKMDAQRTQAESLRRDFTFDESIQIAEEISHVEDGRLQHLKEWSETFIVETTAEKERQETNAADRYAEAIKHHQWLDYSSAINTLETIPVAMRNADHSGWLRRLRSDLGESEELMEQIRSRLKNRALDGLLVLVNRAVELRGDRKDLQKLKVKLKERAARQRDAAQSTKASPYDAAIDRLGADNFVECPLCLAPTKAKNLLTHFDRVHSGEWPLVSEVERLKIVVAPTSMQATRADDYSDQQLVTRQKDFLPNVPVGGAHTPRASTDPQATAQTAAEHEEDKPPGVWLLVVETIFFFFWDNLKVHGWMLLILAPVVAIPWVHFGIGGWYTFGTVSLIGLVLFGFAVADGLDEAIGVLTLPFLYWGAVWFVGWIFF
jgi:serine/threonine protein kinase